MPTNAPSTVNRAVPIRKKNKELGRERAWLLTQEVEKLIAAARKNRRGHRDTSVTGLAAELGIKPVTLYRYVGPKGELRENGKRVLESHT